MLYFKHQELAAKYNVSLRTVHNWIEETKQSKLSLDLHTEGGRSYIANTARNTAAIASLIEQRRKYRNTKAVKVITPKPEFYEVFNQKQIYDIARNLELYGEIPRQYNYFNGGANYWDIYAERLAADAIDTAPNVINSTISLLESNKAYLDTLLRSYSKINIIDVGVGNAYPVKQFLQHLIEAKKLGRYIALDISPSIIEIAKTNITKWFGDAVTFEHFEFDVSHDHFSDLLMSEYIRPDAKDTANIILLLGGTLSNMRNPDNSLNNIHNSMNSNDFLVYTKKLDTETSRRFFDFNLRPGETNLAAIHRVVIDLLNIDPSYYSVELGYKPNIKQRLEQIRLSVALDIDLQLGGASKRINLNKGDAITTWRAHQQTANDVHDQFDRTGFYILHSSQTLDREYILTVSQVKRD